MTKALKFSLILLQITIVGLIIVVGGCSAHKAVAPDDTDSELQAILAVDMVRQLGGDGLAKGDSTTYMLDSASAIQNFTPAGGHLSFVLDGKELIFVIPEGAIPDNNNGAGYEIIVSAEKWTTLTGAVYHYTCLPEGLIFGKPIVLRQPLNDGDDETAGHMFWYNPDLGQWVIDDTKPVLQGESNFEIHHFSKYAIAD